MHTKQFWWTRRVKIIFKNSLNNTHLKYSAANIIKKLISSHNFFNSDHKLLKSIINKINYESSNHQNTSKVNKVVTINNEDYISNFNEFISSKNFKVIAKYLIAKFEIHVETVIKTSIAFTEDKYKLILHNPQPFSYKIT